ncbi:MAG TPA: FliG C-terminal domain-containing protein [Arsenophonus sp.]
MENDSLVITLKGCEKPLRDHFLNNMSHRAAEIMRDDLASRGPVRLSQVEAEQKAILFIVRRLAESGEIIVNGGEDTYSKKYLSQWQPWLPDEITVWPVLNPATHSQHAESQSPLAEDSEKDVLAQINQLDELKAQAKETGYQASYAVGQQAGLTDGQQQGYQTDYQ